MLNPAHKLASLTYVAWLHKLAKLTYVPGEGVQQGGIDSPYLYNIYLYEFDKYVHKYMDELFEKRNKKQKTKYSIKKYI